MRCTLARRIAGASTAGALIAGLNAGSAKADLSCTFGDFSGCTNTDNGVTFSGWQYAPSTTGYDANDTITISYNQVANAHTIFYNFAAAGTNLLQGNSGLLQFTASASGKTFKDATAFF